MNTKKIIMLTTTFLVIASAAPASAGGMSFGGVLLWSSDFGGGAEYPEKFAAAHGHDVYVTPVYGGGFSAFFDVRYVEASVGLFFGGGTWECLRDGKPLDSLFYPHFYNEASVTSVNIDVLAKYPIPIPGRDNMRAYPLLGAAYHLVVGGEGGSNTLGRPTVFAGEGGEDIPSSFELSALWFKFGGGLDYDINEKIYIRGSLLYGVRLPNGYENDILLKDDPDDLYPRSDGKARLGHGLTVRAGVGLNL